MSRSAAFGSVSMAAVLLLVTTGCGVQPDTAPREVPEDNRADLAGTSAGGVAEGAGRIYLVGPGDDRLLRSVPRDENSAVDLLEALLLGANDLETQEQFSSSIPATLQLNDVIPVGSKLRIDVSEELLDTSGTGLIQALAQIVYTASEIEGVESVEITVNGDPQSWPTGDLDSTTQPLRTYDFPGMVRWAQPAYPSLPSS